jgi:hypothetical protein
LNASSYNFSYEFYAIYFQKSTGVKAFLLPDNVVSELPIITFKVGGLILYLVFVIKIPDGQGAPPYL